MKKKEIRPGECWTVKYSNYQGIVLVKSWSEQNKGWICEVAKDLENSWYNKVKGCLFKHKDFRKPSTIKSFLAERIEFLEKEIGKTKEKHNAY